MDLDFDVTFMKPITAGGDVIFTIPFATYNASGSGDFNWTIKLYKVVGVTETQLGSTTTNNESLAGGWTWRSWTGKITIPTTTFKGGEILRFNVVTNDPGSNKYINMYHDPANRSVTTDPVSGGAFSGVLNVRAAINVPLKIDL